MYILDDIVVELKLPKRNYLTSNGASIYSTKSKSVERIPAGCND